jgi:nucleoid DNA-binding protein
LTPVGRIHSIIALQQSQPHYASKDRFQSRDVNKNDIGKAIHDVHGGMSYADALKIVDRILDTIKQRLVRNEKVVITGFGCFRVVVRKDRKGVNPKTGEAMVVPGRKAIIFKPSKYLKSL